MKRKSNFIIYCLVALALLTVLNRGYLQSLMNGSSTEEEVTYDVFLDRLEAGETDKVQVEDDIIYFTVPSQPDMVYYTTVMNDPSLVDRLHDSGVTFSQVAPTTIPWYLSLLLSYGVPILLLLLVWKFFFSKILGKGGAGGNYMDLGKSNARIFAKDEMSRKFSDIAGEEEAKESLMEIVDFLHDPAKYEEIGAKIPKGALLVGPPGTGKTMLAQAVAGEAGVPFFSISGSEFVELFVGMGAAKVRDLFKQANAKAPCIVFIDEIDAIGKKRDTHGFAGNDEREQTLNQLLAEMDGFDARKGVVLLAATNRPESLDPALMRPGRFDRKVNVELPDLRGREAILKVHAKDVKMDDSVQLITTARATAGASGADLANIINEAALRAVRRGGRFVSQQDLDESVDLVLAGQKRKNAIISPREKEIVAYHEVGHAIAAARQEGTAPVQKITIIPRTSGALGFTMQADEEERFLITKEAAFARLVTLTAGRTAEELIFGVVTTGAANDIEQATKLARAMITRYGMSERFGMVAFETVNNPYLGTDTSMSCSPETAARIDEEIVTLVQSAADRARSILRSNMAKLNSIARYLIGQETITGQEFMDMLGEPDKLPPGDPEDSSESVPCSPDGSGSQDPQAANVSPHAHEAAAPGDTPDTSSDVPYNPTVSDCPGEFSCDTSVQNGAPENPTAEGNTVSGDLPV
ncbi:MAG: ATP-dependent zinc metalloprotease FtsH [Oscillospiraceae bacterium]|nr:ATP-dependent zinc metalloprotease FtsH [Oscillospiraceae bacterium]